MRTRTTSGWRVQRTRHVARPRRGRPAPAGRRDRAAPARRARPSPPAGPGPRPRRPRRRARGRAAARRRNEAVRHAAGTVAPAGRVDQHGVGAATAQLAHARAGEAAGADDQGNARSAARGTRGLDRVERGSRDRRRVDCRAARGPAARRGSRSRSRCRAAGWSCPGSCAAVERIAHLTGDLDLADDGRLEAGGHAEQVLEAVPTRGARASAPRRDRSTGPLPSAGSRRRCGAHRGSARQSRYASTRAHVLSTTTPRTVGSSRQPSRQGVGAAAEAMRWSRPTRRGDRCSRTSIRPPGAGRRRPGTR